MGLGAERWLATVPCMPGLPLHAHLPSAHSLPAPPPSSPPLQMNRESSRSHLIITVCIESTNLQTQNVARGKLSFVDLAGSER